MFGDFTAYSFLQQKIQEKVCVMVIRGISVFLNLIFYFLFLFLENDGGGFCWISRGGILILHQIAKNGKSCTSTHQQRTSGTERLPLRLHLHLRHHLPLLTNFKVTSLSKCSHAGRDRTGWDVVLLSLLFLFGCNNKNTRLLIILGPPCPLHPLPNFTIFWLSLRFICSFSVTFFSH